MSPLLHHLWQSTLFALAAALLAYALRGNRPQARYWLWLAASVKFLVPFSLLLRLGGTFAWHPAAEVAAERPVAAAVGQVSQVLLPLGAVSAPAEGWWMEAIGAVWVLGFVLSLVNWRRQWRVLETAKRSGERVDIAAPIAVISTPVLVEPGVFGVFRPVLLLPAGIEKKLSAEQMTALLRHEMCHVQRRDNLWSAVHMTAQAIFWFHPLLRWIGARMEEERERACDEEVIRQGSRPEAYAEGILHVCEWYLQSPLPCAAGVTGADLKKRVREILLRKSSARMTWGRKALLAGAGLVVICVPLLVGVVQAQGPLAFDVVSIRPSSPDEKYQNFNIQSGGGIKVTNFPVRSLIEIAYKLRESQLIGAPDWIGKTHYDILARMDTPDSPADISKLSESERKEMEARLALRTQSILTDRFQFKFHRETREMPILALTVAKGGLKVQPQEPATSAPRHMWMRKGQISSLGMPMSQLADSLSRLLSRTVVDETGIAGEFEYKLEWAQIGDPDASGPTIYTALQEQLGLKLESKKGPVEVVVVDGIEKPTEN